MIMLTYTYGCAACDAVAREDHVIRVHCFDHVAPVPAPCIPQGWQLAGGTLYCARHTITVTVEGREVAV